jgi:hypothetical protein
LELIDILLDNINIFRKDSIQLVTFNSYSLSFNKGDVFV